MCRGCDAHDGAHPRRSSTGGSCCCRFGPSAREEPAGTPKPADRLIDPARDGVTALLERRVFLQRGRSESTIVRYVLLVCSPMRPWVPPDFDESTSREPCRRGNNECSSSSSLGWNRWQRMFRAHILVVRQNDRPQALPRRRRLLRWPRGRTSPPSSPLRFVAAASRARVALVRSDAPHGASRLGPVAISFDGVQRRTAVRVLLESQGTVGSGPNNFDIGKTNPCKCHRKQTRHFGGGRIAPGCARACGRPGKQNKAWGTHASPAWLPESAPTGTQRCDASSRRKEARKQEGTKKSLGSVLARRTTRERGEPRVTLSAPLPQSPEMDAAAAVPCCCSIMVKSETSTRKRIATSCAKYVLVECTVWAIVKRVRVQVKYRHHQEFEEEKTTPSRRHHGETRHPAWRQQGRAGILDTTLTRKPHM